MKLGSRLYCWRSERATIASSAVSSECAVAARTSFSGFDKVEVLRDLVMVGGCTGALSVLVNESELKMSAAVTKLCFCDPLVYLPYLFLI
jgi:hypothetical protein